MKLQVETVQIVRSSGNIERCSIVVDVTLIPVKVDENDKNDINNNNGNKGDDNIHGNNNNGNNNICNNCGNDDNDDIKNNNRDNLINTGDSEDVKGKSQNDNNSDYMNISLQKPEFNRRDRLDLGSVIVIRIRH